MSTSPTIVYVGDSLTYGSTVDNFTTVPYWSDGNLTLPTYEGQPFVHYLDATPGWTLENMESFAPQLLDSHLSTSGMNVAVIWGGTNDFLTPNTTPTQAFAALEQFTKLEQNLGWKVIVVTMIDRTGFDADHDSFDADHDQFNSLILGASFANGIVDLTHTALNPDGASANTQLFQNDGTHLTAAGYAIVGGAVQQAVDNLVSLSVGESSSTACLMSGTMIRTADGEVPVEALEIGCLVLTNDGNAKSVRWLGRQTVSVLFSDPLRVLPIRIKAGALGDDTPSRDLLLSPDHGILIGASLIQAGALVNGTSIVREHRVSSVFCYYHVELDSHSLILAENVPVESFVDNLDRRTFDNWREHAALNPDGKTLVEMPYPRAKSHRQVPKAVRTKLAERANAVFCNAKQLTA